MKVLLDPGHGQNTKGKRSPIWEDGSQLFEWEFTRDVCRRIEKRLTRLKIPSEIIVKEAIDISLPVRVRRADEIYAREDCFLISVHGNAVDEGPGEGWEVWTADEDKNKEKKIESDRLATFLFASAKAVLYGYKTRSDYSDGDPDRESKFYITTKPKCPSVLTENLFYTDPEECRFMMSDFGRELIAKLHVFGIQSYLNQRI